MKTPDEIKKGLECALCDEPADLCGEDCPCWSAYSPAELRQDEHVADALAYIQQLEADNAQQARCVENLTDKLNATNDALPRWISVEERLPEETEDVAAIIRYNEDVWEYGMAFIQGGSWYMNGIGKVVVTHWMSLPEPLKEVP